MVINWNLILESIIAVGVIAFAIGQFVMGRKEVKVSNLSDANATIELFKSRYDAIEAELKHLKLDFEAYKKETLIKEESYKKTISQQEDLVKTYAAILQNRNPELEATLKEIRDFLKKLQEGSLYQTSMLEQQVKDEKGIAHRDRNLEPGRTQ